MISGVEGLTCQGQSPQQLCASSNAPMKLTFSTSCCLTPGNAWDPVSVLRWDAIEAPAQLACSKLRDWLALHLRNMHGECQLRFSSVRNCNAFRCWKRNKDNSIEPDNFNDSRIWCIGGTGHWGTASFQSLSQCCPMNGENGTRRPTIVISWLAMGYG